MTPIERECRGRIADAFVDGTWRGLGMREWFALHGWLRAWAEA